MSNENNIGAPKNEELDLEQYTRQRKYPVLVIDDDKMIQLVFSKYLNSWGFSTLTALDPFEGMYFAIKYRPILIFLDLLMPEIHGAALLKLLKKIDLTADIPVIIISSDLSMETLNKTYKIGAADFISKPFTEEVLWNKVQKFISPAMFSSLQQNGFDVPEPPNNNYD